MDEKRKVECPECHTWFAVDAAAGEHECPKCGAWHSEYEYL